MPTLNSCLRMIYLARAAAQEPESAYVLRTRLKRSVLSAGQLAAAYAGIDEPVMPEDISHVDGVAPECSDVLRLCLSLLSKARTLCQPSEALDSRWRSGWSDVRNDLDALERALLSLERKSRTPAISGVASYGL